MGLFWSLSITRYAAQSAHIASSRESAAHLWPDHGSSCPSTRPSQPSILAPVSAASLKTMAVCLLRRFSSPLPQPCHSAATGQRGDRPTDSRRVRQDGTSGREFRLTRSGTPCGPAVGVATDLPGPAVELLTAPARSRECVSGAWLAPRRELATRGKSCLAHPGVCILAGVSGTVPAANIPIE